MQSVDDLLRKNLEALGERDVEKRRTPISAMWDSDIVFVDPDRPHMGPEAIDDAIERQANVNLGARTRACMIQLSLRGLDSDDSSTRRGLQLRSPTDNSRQE